MAATAKQIELDIRNRILDGTKMLGNSKRGMKEVCSDLVNQHLQSGGKMQALQDGTFLSWATLDRMAALREAESGADYKPNADTCERILRFFGAEVTFTQVAIKSAYLNKPKIEV